MTNLQFWQLIKSFAAGPLVDNGHFYFNAQKALGTIKPSQLVSFNAWPACYLDILQNNIWVSMACRVINAKRDDETLTGFCLWLVAQGEATVLTALQQPDSLADIPHLLFGRAVYTLPNIPPKEDFFDYDAFLHLLGQYTNTVRSSLAFKAQPTGSGCISVQQTMRDIPGQLPQLVALAQQQGFAWQTM